MGNEILFHGFWYHDGIYPHYAIFHSQDYGESLDINYEYLNSPDSSFILGSISDDATPGVLYNFPYWSTQFGISYDQGSSWEPITVTPSNGSFLSGKMPGEVFHYGFSTVGYLARSNDYGQTFDTINSDAKFSFFLGAEYNTIYATDRIYQTYNQYYLSLSNNNGVSFGSWIEIDTSVSGLYIEKLFRGANPGEIYLVSKWPPDNYQIFFSPDDGQSWQFRHRTSDINFWTFNFTPGSETGIFYYARTNFDPTGTYILLYLYYSLDTAYTFTTFYHELTPDVGVSDKSKVIASKNLLCSPIPTRDYLTISNLDGFLSRTSNTSLEIYNATGLKIEELLVANPDDIKINTSAYLPGIYFVVITNGRQRFTTSKFIVQR